VQCFYVALDLEEEDRW